MHVLRGRFKSVPSVDEIERLAKSILDYVSEQEHRVAIFLGSKMDHGGLTLEHLTCIARTALSYRSAIKQRVLGTKFLLRGQMTTAFRILLEAFHTFYTPIRPFLITDNDEESSEFEAKVHKEFASGQHPV